MGEAHDFERASSDAGEASSLERCSPTDGLISPVRNQAIWRTLVLQATFPRLLRLLTRRLLISSFLLLVLFADIIAGWPILQPSTAFALSFKNPDPALSAPSWLTAAQPANVPQTSTPSRVTPPIVSAPSGGQHAWPVPMKPDRLTLTNAAQHFTSSDGQLRVDVAANSLSSTQLAQHAGGIWLYISQVKPGGGGASGGEISFGTYEFQWFDSSGLPLDTVQLQHPLTIHFHLRPDQQTLLVRGQQVYTVWNAVQGAAVAPALTAQAQTQAMQATIAPQVLSTQTPTLSYAQHDSTGLDWSIQSNLGAPASSTSKTGNAAQVSSGVAVPASTVAFGTQAPQATWGDPTQTQVSLNAGGLTYSDPLSVPAGPGGLEPTLALNYSSGAVNENHGWQSVSSWVGQGWSLDLGAITWSQENVTPNGSATEENVWNIDDPGGIGGQLIPPDQNDTTAGTINPSLSQLQSGVFVWRTAPYSAAKVEEYSPPGSSVQCWRVYLPNGTMEEFGCQNLTQATFQDSSGIFATYAWKLDMIVDRYGNQVHITYQERNGSTAIHDLSPEDITYDSPACQSTTTMCTGSAWNPIVDIHFDANPTAARLLSGSCGSWSSVISRCDDPADLSSSGGLPAPSVVNEYILNDVQVQVQGNLLHEYLLSYNQGGPQTVTDPNTDKSESAAGYLTLGKIQEEGTNGTALNAPVVTATYTQETEHYSDTFEHANPTTNCSPYSAAPRDGGSTGACYLWSQSFNQYYLTNLDNGRGWNESISWKEAHSNTWGVDSGSVADAFNCSSSQTSTNICGRADDKNWSRVVVASRTAVSNGVSSTWSYQYTLPTGISGAPFPGHSGLTCASTCSQTYDWGNQNDDDDADYYNGDFQSFAQVKVTQPDTSTQVDTYGATDGWGLYSSSITCVTGGTCVSAPYNASTGPVLAGKQTQEQDYDNSGNLLKQINWTWTTNCPPQGVAGSVHALGGSTDPGTGFLFSELDHNNPVLVCDPRSTQEDTYAVDGVDGSTLNTSDPKVLHTTSTTTYDGNTCGTTGRDYDNVSQQNETANDVGGAHIVSATLFCPNDAITDTGGVFLTDLPAQTQTEDGSGTSYNCAQNFYGGNTSVTAVPTLPEATSSMAYTSYNGGCTGSAITTTHSYDSFGTDVANTDPDGHLGCTSGSTQYSACATYDSFDTHLLTAANAKNQVTTYEYDQDAAQAGFGEWLMAKIDPNGQTTTYEYDALGRLTEIIEPGDSVSTPTVTYAYNNTCSAGKTTPCLEIVTSTRFTTSGPLSVMEQWYDGWGNLVETQVPGPNLFSKVPAIGSLIVTYTIYNNMDEATTKSDPYAVAVTAGLGYVAPDLNQARTVTAYDNLGRLLGVVSYSNATTIVQSSSTSYTVAQGVSTLASESSNAYEQTITLDAYNHQSITYTDGLGQVRYSQVFSGTASPYSVVRTVGTTYDVAGNTLSTVTYDSTGAARVISSSVYNGLKRMTGSNDSDQGACTNIPMPTDCSSTTDTAWKYTYDADGNQLSQTDPRGISTYTSYDVLDRPLCSALSAGDASSCGGTTNEVYFYDSYSNAGTPGATFPSACVAPTGAYASDPIGHETAEQFVGAGGAGSGWRCSGYDQRGRTDQSTLSVTTPDAGAVTQTVNMAYDDQNDVTSLVYPDGEVLTSNYNSDGRFQSAYFGTSSSTDPVTFLVGQTTYTNNGQLSSLALGGSAAKNSTPTALFTLNQGYDSLQRVVSTSAVENGTTLFSQTRTYDNDGNVLGLATATVSSTGSAVSENEAFCYDALNRLAWAGNTGTPTGGDHCMSLPSNSGISSYSQAYSSDNLDRLTSSAAGTYTYGDASQVHGVTSVSSVPNPYAAYDAMGNEICRNTDPTTAHSCAAGSLSGATMSYDNEGRLESWTAQSGTSADETYLYDNSGNLVLTTSSVNGTPTDTIDFDNYTETVLTGGTTTTTKYYSINGQRLAEKVNGALSYLVTDLLSNVVMAIGSGGTVEAVEFFEPYGSQNYSWGSMPTDRNYTGQQKDSESGLLYYQFRWYDPLTGEFVRTDTKQTNAQGMDPYAYVSDNPETKNDPTGHWGWDTILAVTAIAIVAAVVVIAAPVVIAAVAATAIAAADIAVSATVAAGAAIVSGDIAGAAGAALTMGYAAAYVGGPIATALADDGAGDAGAASAAASNPCGDGLSFASTTLVATYHGKQAIGTLKVGEKVWSYNPQTRKMELEPIQKVWLNHDNDLVDLTLVTTAEDAHGKSSQQKETIHTNEKHPFLTKEKGFLPVSQLKPGMHVLEANGQYGIVATLVVVPGSRWLYNLTVAQDHTYAVGLDQWIVHNVDGSCGDSTPGDNLPDRGPNNTKTNGVFVNNNQTTQLESGKYGPAQSMPDDTPGMMKGMFVRDHVEADAAALMRLQELDEGTLYVNNTPCGGDYGCNKMLPHMLPEGSTLTIFYKDAVRNITDWVEGRYTGLPDEDWEAPPPLRKH